MPVLNSLYFTDSKGDGPPLVLIHGAGGAHLHWPPQLRRLASARVIALDLPGHGKSGGTPCAAIGELAQALVEFLDALAIERAVFAGSSMGGGIAQLLALDYPDRVMGLALIGTSARLRVSPELLGLIGRDFPAAVSRIVEWCYSANAPDSLTRLARERMLEIKPGVLLADFNACNAFDVRARVSQISSPSLILVGSDDRMTPEKYSRALAEQIAGAQLQIIPGAGHMVMLERPEEVTAAIGTLITQISQKDQR